MKDARTLTCISRAKIQNPQNRKQKRQTDIQNPQKAAQKMTLKPQNRRTTNRRTAERY
ncbi:MAG: hypothetical protein K6F33_00265 [Bacteroidales bacterium]|nr:hypothetical protein [Bacteroidales bacterium]